MPKKPLDILIKFFPRHLMEQWAGYTYRRWQLKQQKEPRVFKCMKLHFAPNYTELMLFFSILLYMSIYRERKFDAYWAVREDLPCHPISR